MLPSLIMNAFFAIGKLLIRIVYGEYGWKASKTLKKNTDFLALLLTIGFLVWLFNAIFLVGAIVEGIGSVIKNGFLVVFTTALFVMWCVHARKVTVPALVAEAKPIWDGENASVVVANVAPARVKTEIRQNFAADEAAKAAGWTCTCGRVNAAYVSGCVCGMSKQEAKIKLAQQKKEQTDEQ